MTLEGKKKLEKELLFLKEEKQKEINDEVKHLRGFCDFSEDMTFRQKLEEQSRLTEKINMIEDKLYKAEIIEKKDKQTTVVEIGNTVTFQELSKMEEETYTIVGTIDADPENNKISSHSPIGKSLLGCKVNDEIFIETPLKKLKVKIKDIS